MNESVNYLDAPFTESFGCRSGIATVWISVGNKKNGLDCFGPGVIQYLMGLHNGTQSESTWQTFGKFDNQRAIKQSDQTTGQCFLLWMWMVIDLLRRRNENKRKLEWNQYLRRCSQSPAAPGLAASICVYRPWQKSCGQYDGRPGFSMKTLWRTRARPR